MLLTRRNFRAGRPLKTFPLEEENGMLGFKLGYCSNCNESVLLCKQDTQTILAYLFKSEKQYKKLIQKLEPRFSYYQKFIKWLLGKLGEFPKQGIEHENKPVYNF